MTDRRLLAVAAVTGAAVMVLELMGVRLAAPWFGQSQLVWTNVIGVVLASLAAGQWLGGRWAENGRGPGPSSLLLSAGAVSLGLPEIVACLGPLVLPRELGLLEAHPFVILGSLLVSLVGLGLPMLALGAVTPWLVRLSREASAKPGKVAGRLLGAGTLGSLVGTFGASHLLLPHWGSAGAVRVAGGLLMVAGLLLWGASTERRLGVMMWLFFPVLMRGLPAPDPLPGLLEQRETPYQWARVVEQSDGSRLLQLNEGLDSYHSIWTRDPIHTGAYYDAFLAPALAAPPASDGRRDILLLGLAAGTMARQIHAVDPRARITGVEIDAEIVALGRRWFDLPASTQVVAGVDARVAIAHETQRYGAILIDAYSQQVYLPAHLCTREFFADVIRRLLPGGVVALNVSGLSLEDPVVDAVANTLSGVFARVLAGRVPGTRNMILLACSDSAPDLKEFARVVRNAGLGEMLEWMFDGSRLSVVAPRDRAPLRDGHAPLEALAHASWSSEWVPAPEPSSTPPGVDGLELARLLMRQTRWSAAAARLAPMLEQADPSIRAGAALLLGNIGFERGRFGRAQALYRQVTDDVPHSGPLDPTLLRAADENLATVRTRLERARKLGGAEQTLALTVGLLLLACLGGVLVALDRSR